MIKCELYSSYVASIQKQDSLTQMNSIDIFPWNDNFNTGIPLVDEQHRKLAQLINLLASHIAFHSDLPALNVIFDELTDYAAYHFETEEKIWHEYMPEDPSEVTHIQNHNNFITEVLKLKAGENIKSVNQVVEEILAFLTQWLAAHILESDRAMAMVVIAMQSGMPLIAAKKCAAEQMKGTTKALIGIILSIYETLSANTLHLMRELAEQKRLAVLLDDQEQHFEALLSTTPVGVFETDKDGKCRYVNARWSDITGVSFEKAMGDGWMQTIHPEDRDKINAEWNASATESRPFHLEYRFLKPNGHIVWVLGNSANFNSRLNNQSGYVGTITDITRQKLIEENLLNASEKNLVLLRNASDGIHILNIDGNVIEASDSFCAMLGYSRDEIIGMNASQWDASFKKAELLDQLRELFCDIARNQFETRYRRKDNTFFEVEISAHSLELDGAQLLFCSTRDISTRKKIERALQTSEAHLRTIVENEPECIKIVDAQGLLVDMNPAGLNMIEADSLKQVIGLPVVDLIAPEYRTVFTQMHQRVIAGEKMQMEFEIIGLKGGQHWVETHAVPFQENDVTMHLAVTRDVNERKNTELAELARSHIMEMLNTDTPLEEILKAIATDIEQRKPGVFCSVLLLDDAGKHIATVVAPSLPAFYSAAVIGSEIDMGTSPCGIAAFTGELVVVEDMTTHPNYTSYQELAAQAELNLSSFWSQPIHSASGKVLGTVTVFHHKIYTPTLSDIAQIGQSANLASIAIARKQAQMELKIAATVFESQEGMLVTDANSIILRVNQAFTNITGYSNQDVIGQTPRILNSGKQTKDFYTSMWNCLNKSGYWEGEIWNRRKNGEIYPEHLTITAVKDAHDNVSNYVATLTDITMSKAASEEIKSLAFYDFLTKLPNRRLLLDRLNQALASSARSGLRGALLFLDLDHFKTLNDTLGHDVGDLLLQQVAERLTACIREGDTTARLGGDEFVVLLEDLNADIAEVATQTKNIGNKILASLSEPYQLAAHEYHCTISMGVALFNNHDISVEELLKQADIAMYQAKAEGRNTLRFFDPVMQQAINLRSEIERELHNAITLQQFELYYQVQVDSTNRPIGAEALIRWRHPQRGMISPFEFISLAEETNLILPIGSWVLDTACAQLKVWQQQPHTRHLSLSINVSAKQFYQASFASEVFAMTQKHAINPMLLNLELTEGMLIENIEQIITTMHALQTIGVRFELDDFGTGYSSLQYLKKLPLYQLKIDQSFVKDLATDSNDQAIVRTIIAMANSMNLDVIAEGVETEAQLASLKEYGCTKYQGYLFGKPLPNKEFEQSLN